MIKRLVRKLGTLVLLLAATSWLATSPGYEPLIAVLTFFGALVAYEVLDQRAALRGERAGTPSRSLAAPQKAASTLHETGLVAFHHSVPRPRTRPIPPVLEQHLQTAIAVLRYLEQEERAVPLSELNRETLYDRILGIEVTWPLRVQSLSRIPPETFILTGVDHMRLIEVLDISTSTSPEVAFLKEGDEILATGTISKIHKLGIYLTAGRVRLQRSGVEGV